MRANAQADLVANAMAESEIIQQTHHRRAFEHAVTEFRHILTSVPDYGPHQLSPDALGALCALAEGVIARIEERVGTAGDPGLVQRHLVEAIYEIRRALEEIDRWRRHYSRMG